MCRQPAAACTFHTTPVISPVGQSSKVIACLCQEYKAEKGESLSPAMGDFEGDFPFLQEMERACRFTGFPAAGDVELPPGVLIVDTFSVLYPCM